MMLLMGPALPVRAQSSLRQRETGRAMLERLRDLIKEHYYDPAFHGVDLDALYKGADESIKQAETEGQIVAIVSGFSLSLDDPHTRFYPGSRAVHYDYGWDFGIVGDNCFITSVKPSSDADKQGVKPGDKVISIFDDVPSRTNLWRIRYFMYTISPQRVMKLTLQSPGGTPRKVDIATNVSRPFRPMDGRDLAGFQRYQVEIQKYEKVSGHRFYELGTEALIWRVPDFEREKFDTSKLFKHAKKFRSLIIDLRGNGGGEVETMLAIIANLFDRDVKIGELAYRRSRKPLLAKTRGKQAFTGKVTVLIDSETASLGEVFARTIQLEKRGTVIGDRSSGRASQWKTTLERLGAEAFIIYWVSVTVADVLLGDGKSLEKVGVTPDELLFPTPADLAARRDPVLARACSLNGVPMEPTQAGTLFPYLWPE
jgi:C-terminal processing protease CtpA/Prc